MKQLCLLFVFLFAFTILVSLSIIVVGGNVENVGNVGNIEDIKDINDSNDKTDAESIIAGESQSLSENSKKLLETKISENAEDSKDSEDSQITEINETSVQDSNVSNVSDVSNISNISDISDTNILQAKQIYITVLDAKTGTVFTADLEEYLCGVVFAEMPSSFEIEALKAQAVAARSFCVYKMLYPSDNARELHKGADICGDYKHCKDYISYESACEKYGEDYIAPVWEKIKKAVSETEGEIIVYETEPAIAVFHAMSGRETESAANVWGAPIPYLLSVPSEEENYKSEIKNYITENRFAVDDFKAILLSEGSVDSSDNADDFTQHPHLWVSDIKLNSSNRVDTVRICGKYFTGIQIREIFSLRSTNFDLKYDNKNKEFIFTVTGYGHGVGMSQYGANLMAKEGRDYINILLWYYTGVEIMPMYGFF